MVVVIIIGIILLFFSHIVGRISKKKGSSYFFGFITSFVLSPFIGYLIVSLKKEQLSKKDSKDCPFCFNKIHKNSIKCIHCNEMLYNNEYGKEHHQDFIKEEQERKTKEQLNKEMGRKWDSFI